MVTAEDAINAYITWQRRNAWPIHNAAYLRRIDITVRILQQTPRNITIINRILDQKKTKMRQARYVEDIDNLRNEITAWEWLRMIVNGSEQEWANWALLAKAV